MGMRPLEFLPVDSVEWQLEMEISDVQHGGIFMKLVVSSRSSLEPQAFCAIVQAWFLGASSV